MKYAIVLLRFSDFAPARLYATIVSSRNFTIVYAPLAVTGNWPICRAITSPR
jgi:hypothetical protein